MRFLFTFICLIAALCSFSQPKAFALYTSNGKEVKWEKMIDEMAKADVVLLGELHNNPISHWMQLEITKALHQKRNRMILGAEMFESDNQLLIDEYFRGKIRKKDFENEARLWNNYKTDYEPLLEFANKNVLRFVASNTPRRYAAYVARNGMSALDSLSREALAFLPPLPIPFDSTAPGYKEMMDMKMGHGNSMLHMVQAQALKDATMAHHIIDNRIDDLLFVHFQGDYHSANKGGIYWYLKYWRPNLKILVLSTVEAPDTQWNTDFCNKADFVLIVPENMTKTY